MRDKLIHAYEIVDVELVLKTVRERIPATGRIGTRHCRGAHADRCPGIP
jgi:uncharacterized protein with HEPN domain